VKNGQGKLVNNPIYDHARLQAGGVNWRGVAFDLISTAFGVGTSVFGGPIGSSEFLFDVDDVLRAGWLVGSSAAKAAGSGAVRCGR
jgi:hypothetical protein